MAWHPKNNNKRLHYWIFIVISYLYSQENEEWGWSGESNDWSDKPSSKSSSQISKKSSSSAVSSKKEQSSSKNEDLLIDFGGAGSNNGSKNKQEDSWASWENDAWESLNKKD